MVDVERKFLICPLGEKLNEPAIGDERPSVDLQRLPDTVTGQTCSKEAASVRHHHLAADFDWDHFLAIGEIPVIMLTGRGISHEDALSGL